MGFESESGLPMNAAAVSDVVKKLLVTFFRANIPFAQGLDIYGSIHVRSDDYDVVCCVLNEHCFKPDKASNSDDKILMMSLSGTAGIQPGGSNNTNALNSNEYLPDWKAAGTRKSCGKKPVPSLVRSEGHAGANLNDDNDDDETKAKCKRLPGLSRKLSKLNRASIESMNSSAQSIFPEPLTFGLSRNQVADDEMLEAKQQSCSVAEDALENDGTDKSRCRSDDQVSSDDPGIDLAMAATSEAYTPQKNDSRFDNDGEMADVDSSDSRDFDSIEKGVSYTLGSQQSFTQQLTPLSGSNTLPVNFGETEMFSQAAWIPSDPSARGVNQAGCSNSFDGSIKTPGPLTSEKICMYCLKIFHTNLEMSQHIQQQHNSGFPLLDGNDERPYRPRYQNAYAYGASELDVDRQLTCSVCSLSFRSLDGLRCHENSKHSRNKLYKCQFCTQSFLTRQAAYTHRMKFHRLVPRNSRLLTGAMARI